MILSAGQEGGSKLARSGTCCLSKKWRKIGSYHDVQVQLLAVFEFCIHVDQNEPRWIELVVTCIIVANLFFIHQTYPRRFQSRNASAEKWLHRQGNAGFCHFDLFNLYYAPGLLRARNNFRGGHSLISESNFSGKYVFVSSSCCEWCGSVDGLCSTYVVGEWGRS